MSGFSRIGFVPAADIMISTHTVGGQTSQIGAIGLQSIAPWSTSVALTISQAAVIPTVIATGTVRVLIFDADALGRPTALLAQSAAIDVTGTINVIKENTLPFTFVPLKQYWIGYWSSDAVEIKLGARGRLLSWTPGASLPSQNGLERIVAYGGTSPDWTYAATDHSRRDPLPQYNPIIYMRIA